MSAEGLAASGVSGSSGRDEGAAANNRPADPSVSPADTIRRARNRIAARGQHDLVGLADLADALLAVGERDKAERERDRRQIARLTEFAEWIAVEIKAAKIASSLSADTQLAALWEVVRHHSEAARAVLADEEDARP